MSDASTTPVPEPDPDPQPEPAPSGAQGLRAQAEKVPVLEDENTNLKRELAFTKAGVPDEGEIARLFRLSYTGDVTPEAVGERWQALRSELQTSGVTVDPGTSAAAAVATTHQATQVGVPGQVVPPPPEDPLKVGYEEFHKARAQGVPEEDASNHVIGRMLAAAYGPDGDLKDRFVITNVPGGGEMTRAEAKARGLI